MKNFDKKETVTDIISVMMFEKNSKAIETISTFSI
jgi:hypothetical protein